jgi:hypothetical protein
MSHLYPVCVTQRSCESVLGVSRRWFLDYLARHPEIPRTRIGRNIIVSTGDWLAHVASVGADGDSKPTVDDWTPGALLARRGLRAAGGDR